MTAKTKISVVTLGCPKNIVDTEYLLGQLNRNGTEIVDSTENADTLIINTCGFIRDAKQESVDAIIEAVGKKSRGELKKIVVMGCLPERYKAELAKEIPEVDYFFGTNELEGVLGAIGTDLKRELIGERFITTPSHYAYLKISEGCNNPCSFCAIPIMRGEYRSRPIDELVREARTLAGKGVRELIVIGQDTTYYGLDIYGRRMIARLIGELNNIDGIEWIRLMYTYPSNFPADLIDAFNTYGKLCHYIDIPIQHCSDRVLKSMRRGITKRATSELLTRLKREIPDIGLRTTLIVGYPGETEEEFRELYDFVGEMRFQRLGVFQYSQEEGTAAFGLGDPVAKDIKEERQERLMEFQKGISEERNGSLIGQNLKAVIDSRENEFFIGRTEWDAPEIDNEVLIRSDKPLKVGTFENVKITDSAEYDLFASV